MTPSNFTPATKRIPSVSRLGFGSFKIGRNEGIKYPSGYALPTDAEVATLLNGILDLGCNLIDTAPAYGLSEERVGRAIGHRRDEFVLSTKVGETFEGGQSTYDYSAAAVRASIERSLRRLATDQLDIVFIHSNGDDHKILTQTDVVPTLLDLRSEGIVRAIGMSGKTVEGAQLALSWADALMVEYNLKDQTHGDVITEAADQGIAVFVKKGLGSGNLPAAESIRFVLTHAGVSSLIVGGLSLPHFTENWGACGERVDGRK
ncbi:MAG: aldo/keto reductase [Schlesneria sp.]|nr:aldo/keto reductase [Schlesneria sp.]